MDSHLGLCALFLQQYFSGLWTRLHSLLLSTFLFHLFSSTISFLFLGGAPFFLQLFLVQMRQPSSFLSPFSSLFFLGLLKSQSRMSPCNPSSFLIILRMTSFQRRCLPHKPGVCGFGQPVLPCVSNQA